MTSRLFSQAALALLLFMTVALLLPFPGTEGQVRRRASWRLPAMTSRHKRSDDGGPLGSVVETLSQQVVSLSAQLTAVKTEVAQLKVKAAKDELAVAFHVRSLRHTFDVLPGGPIILPHVITSVGTGYDETTGYFRAPVTGTYLFVATATVDNTPGGLAWVNISVDGVMMAQLVTAAGLHQGSVAVPVHLRAGQRVHLTNGDPVHAATLKGEIYTTFSGVLVQSD